MNYCEHCNKTKDDVMYYFKLGGHYCKDCATYLDEQRVLSDLQGPIDYSDTTVYQRIRKLTERL